MSISENYELFNRLLFDVDRISYSDSGFLVHSSILGNLRNFLKNHHHNLVYDYKLKIDQRQYDMKLIHITESSNDVHDLIEYLIQFSQFSFPWLKLPNLFRDEASYNSLLKFIEVYKYGSDIENIEENVAFASHDHIIKVVTFNENVNKIKLYDDYRIWIESKNRPTTYYYYITKAFDWLQPSAMEHYTLPIENYLLETIMPLVIDRVSRLKYSKKLNIFDLLSLKIGLWDMRNPLRMEDIRTCIDRALAKILMEMKLYIYGNAFYLDKYLIDKNIAPSESLINYFRYEYQNYFKMVHVNDVENLLTPSRSLNRRRIPATIELTEEYDSILDIVEESYNVVFTIDCSNFCDLHLSLFLRLTSFDNVAEIILNANCFWDRRLDDNFKIIKTVSTNKIITVKFVGNNYNKFIEDFLTSLSNIPYTNTLLDLFITRPLRNYLMFDNLAVGFVTFDSVMITNGMADDLSKCNIKTKIRFRSSTYENEVTVHQLILKMRINSVLQVDNFETIVETNYMWQELFECFGIILLKSDHPDAKIDNLQIIYDGDQKINLNDVAFTLLNDKVELKDRHTNEIVDLYYLKNKITPDDRSAFSFYE